MPDEASLPLPHGFPLHLLGVPDLTSMGVYAMYGMHIGNVA